MWGLVAGTAVRVGVSTILYSGQVRVRSAPEHRVATSLLLLPGPRCSGACCGSAGVSTEGTGSRRGATESEIAVLLSRYLLHAH